ncbi:uncharacterized protein LOC129572842 [Sitodiplosis mosellana]|uniref:uncharacterized protein LOC129572842 n=1 Tax=Sitodiplosis mosellana TaxID=263140 RepID=UPI0024438B3F|nr:uncharacterized protein LOC129572842 [Sitodiplosis mosellana]
MASGLAHQANAQWFRHCLRYLQCNIHKHQHQHLQETLHRSTSNYAKWESKEHIETERSPLKIDQFALAREIELLRIKIKTLKDNLKEIEKSHSKELKKKKKRFAEHLKEKDDSLKEKDAVFATMEQKITMLETTNTRLMQDLQNGRLEVKMLHETLVKVCGGRNQNGV